MLADLSRWVLKLGIDKLLSCLEVMLKICLILHANELLRLLYLEVIHVLLWLMLCHLILIVVETWYIYVIWWHDWLFLLEDIVSI